MTCTKMKSYRRMLEFLLWFIDTPNELMGELVPARNLSCIIGQRTLSKWRVSISIIARLDGK